MMTHIGVKAATYENGESLADVMTWQHFGTETIPPRPVLRIAAENVLNADRAKGAESIVAQYLFALCVHPEADHAQLERVLLAKLGQRIVTEAKRIIDAGDELQHNAPATVARKGFDKPLYETGLMQKNISYEIGE